MTDENQPNDQAPNTDALVEAILSKIEPAFDKRFQGFQGILDRRDSEYRQMLEDLQNSGLEPEQREQVEADRLKRERDEYKRKLDILSMRKDFPEEVDMLDALLEGKSLQDQLSLLSNFRKVTTEAESQEGDETPEQPTPVVKNNPKRDSVPSLADASGKMNKELSKQILGSDSAKESGILSRLRRS